jgi:hypothetical protein
VKYVLVDQGDNITTTVDLASNIGLSGAKTYFKGVKQIDEKSFDKLWKVMTKDEYDRLLDLSHRQNKQYEWWKEDKEITDSELKF